MGEDRSAFKWESEQRAHKSRSQELFISAGDRLFEEKQRVRKPRSPRMLTAVGRWSAIIASGMLAAAVAAGVLVFGLLKWSEPALPVDADLYALNRPASYTFVTESGERLGLRGAIVGERLKLSEMPLHLPAAFLTVEDRRFYSHPGFDIRGVLRAAQADFSAGGYVQGGSTITQQVVKAIILTPERTISRKLAEISGAIALERRLTKEQILELYLNRIYLGSGAYGVDGAAHAYFGKSARDITLAEAAMLAGLTTAPSSFSPRRDLAMAQMRAERVLATMAAEGAITAEDLARARANPATLMGLPLYENGRDYFLDAAAEEARKLTKDKGGDFTVVATLDVAMQKAAHTSLSNVMNRRASASHANQAALVALATDGAVRAMVGGRDYAESAFNRVTQAHRQPGSSFKPFVYLAALESGLKPWTVRVDQPIKIKNWSPDNYAGTFAGPVTLQQALARSLNSIAVQLGQEVGLKKVIEVARRLGIESPLQPYPSLPIGTFEVTPLEMAGAYTAFATAGIKATPYTVVQIRDATRSVVFQHAVAPPKRIIADADALALNAMLYQVVQSGTARAAIVPGHEVAGKTGTSTEFHDAWFFGFSPQLVAGVWVGNDDSTSMKKITGGTLPAQIWTGFMRVALKNSPNVPLPRSHEVEPEQLEIAQDEEGAGVRFDGLDNFYDRLTEARGTYSQSAALGENERLAPAQESNRPAGSLDYAQSDRPVPRADSDRPVRRLKYNRYGSPPPRTDEGYDRAASYYASPPPPPAYYERPARDPRYNRYNRPPPPPSYYDRQPSYYDSQPYYYDRRR